MASLKSMSPQRWARLDVCGDRLRDHCKVAFAVLIGPAINVGFIALRMETRP